jgi:hypothetical protein
MIVGIAVLAVPALRDTPSIPPWSANPFITIPILLLWPLTAHSLARQLVADSAEPAADGLRVGLVFLAVNAALDRAVVVGALNAGAGFYSSVGLWLAYLSLVFVPWATGRATTRQAG